MSIYTKEAVKDIESVATMERVHPDSLGGAASNTIIIPAKKSNKRKVVNEGKKEIALLLSNTIGVLERDKISEGAHALLQSSQNSNQVESENSKRRKAILVSEAGLEIRCTDQPFKKKGVNGAEMVTQSRQGLDKNDEEKLKEGSKNSRIASQIFNFTEPRSQSSPTVVHISRPTDIEDARKDLPIVMMEQEIMEAINDHSIVIICGETGCGKTTQVPQFLFEAGFGASQSGGRNGIIGVTQPRRVAVLATAKRVPYELGLHLGKEVGFQVRYDKRIGESCSIKFMTDGILLREIQQDFLLKRYSAIIIDEAHERSLHTDILIGMLSRAVCARQIEYVEQQKAMLLGKLISPGQQVFPLKLVLMSATLRVKDFDRRLFLDPPPVIEVPTRQFPVTIHFEKRTNEEVHYVDQAFRKVMKIHERLPHGGILVFVTGRKEVEYLCQKLLKASKELLVKRSIGRDPTKVSEISSVEAYDDDLGFSHGSASQKTDKLCSSDEDYWDVGDDDLGFSSDLETESELEILGNDGDSFYQDSSEFDADVTGVVGENGTIESLKHAFEALSGETSLHSNSVGRHSESVTLEACLNQSNRRMGKKGHGGVEKDSFPGALRVLPLYAMLPAAAQFRVFERVKEGERLVVVATNVAETSLTIPWIKYVVDSGKEKVKNYNFSNGIETYEIQWISKASAAQRAGRAGRTGPGHCYRLYSSAVYNNQFPEFSVAEISKVPFDGVLLFLKSMNIEVSRFPFPTPPTVAAMDEANYRLNTLNALDSTGKLTPLGNAMAHYPLSPRHSRMLLTVIQIMHKHEGVRDEGYLRANLVLAYAVAAAAALSLSSPFVRKFEGSHTRNHDLDEDENSSVQAKIEVVEKQELMKRKKLNAFREKFSNPSSDALSTAYALQCYELSKSPAKFCYENCLHSKTMEELSKLRKQLLKLVIYETGISGGEEFSWIYGSLEEVEHAWRVSHDKSPLSLYEEEILGQAICAGWADRVAKRIRGTSLGSSEGDRKVNAVRYQACKVNETVFLSPWSSVSNSAPEFLVFNELIWTTRPYMHGVTRVKSEWLVEYARSLCTTSPTPTDTRPHYDPLTDQVLSYVIPSFGPYLWELPPHPWPISIYEVQVKAFAYALLEGQVLPCLRPVRKFMADRPDSVLKPEAKCRKRVWNLLDKLLKRKINSCAMLREVWKENPKELQPEMLDWFQNSFRNSSFTTLWSNMLSEVSLKPQKRFPKKL